MIKRTVKRITSIFLALIICFVSPPAQQNSAKAYIDMAQRILNDTSLGLTAEKKRTMATIADAMLDAGFEPAFIAGALGNIALEGSFGLFEGTTSVGHTDYMKYMNKHYQYYQKYSYKYIYNCNFAEVCTIDNELYNLGYPGKFGLGCCQWTGDRTHCLLRNYKKVAGNSSTITYEQVMVGECLTMIEELNGECTIGGHNKRYVYTNWLSQYFGNLSSTTAAEMAGRVFCTEYERPSNYQNKQYERGEMAAKIYAVCGGGTPLPCKINDISGYGGPTEGYVHTPGANCGLYGTITSNHPLKHVWGGVYKQDGTKAPGSSTTCDDYPNTTSYSLRGTFNNTIIFDDIPVGSYFFSIYAEDSDRYSREVYHCNFTVGNASITVSFNANGGTVSPISKTYSIGGKYLDMPTPTRKGYIFDGWYSATNGGTKVANGSALVSSSSHTLYAHWKDDMRKIYFNANGGLCSTEYITRRYGDKYGDMPDPSNSGFKFLGWYTAAQGGELRNTSSEVVEVNNYTLYAHWKKSEYTISFDGNGGKASSNSKKVTYGGTYGNLPSCSKTGYTLKGWFTAKSGGTQITLETKVSTASDHTLYAQWKANQYNITLIYNDGTDRSEIVKVTYYSMYGLKAPEREGYFFNGWFTAATGGTQVAADAKVAVASDQTLYAHWSKDQLMLTFDSMGGKAITDSKLLTYDNRYGILPEAERTGYTFEGWYLDKAYTQPITETDVVKATGNQTAYAKWSIRQYIVTFDAGEGTADAENKKVIYGKAYGVLPDAAWNDKELLGWFTEDGTEITSDSIVEESEDITVYAKWRIKGDVDADGDVDIDDVIMLQQWLLAVPDAPLTDWQAVDLYQDERIDVFDLCLLKRWLIERNGEIV